LGFSRRGAETPRNSRSVGILPTKHPLSVPTLHRSGSRNGFRWLLSGHRTPPSKFFQNSATFRSPPSPCPPFLRGEKFRYVPLSDIRSPVSFLPPRPCVSARNPLSVSHSRASSVIRGPQKPRKPLRQNSNPEDHRPRNFFKIPLRSAFRPLPPLYVQSEKRYFARKSAGEWPVIFLKTRLK
jgi:hypothetical protein